ncbi:phospho-acceptor domain-containing protein [Christiangramia gaetbulicola]|uniref:histidine kinase n=1 Tax=Christiangramia gaetbulicola TaxID=703340 RepID=A0A2T6ACS7_9FLAO|nr:GAF domain-containing sensor histidine kinase [Christiangramia gaetbulicola]PTX41609.1 phospho-acceptor domain-containing protein [Christiangramia gaetbulicola]
MLNEIIENDEAEYQRIKSLSKFDLDYNELQEEFKSLVQLSAMIAGTEMSVINLIDNYYQWTVTAFSSKLLQMPREESICDRTIRTHEPLEISDLEKDERFKDRGFSKGDSGFNYYLGIPLTLESGDNIGALCVLDKNSKEISDRDKSMLRLVASEIVNKLEHKRKMDETIFSLNKAIKTRNQVAHDVRGPITGITGLAEVAASEDSSKEEMVQYFRLIKDSGNSVLELTNDILKSGLSNDPFQEKNINLKQLKEKLLKLYRLPSKSKNIDFQIKINPEKSNIIFSRRKLLSVFGNLISNAIKFTPANGKITVDLDVLHLDKGKYLKFKITDNGVGISKEALAEFKQDKLNSTRGTSGEEGFGLGLKLVRDMVTEFRGEMDISSKENAGTEIEVKLLLN